MTRYENYSNIWTTAIRSPHAGDANRNSTKNAKISPAATDTKPATRHDAGAAAAAAAVPTEHAECRIIGTRHRHHSHRYLGNPGDRRHAWRRRGLQPALQPLRRRRLDERHGRYQPVLPVRSS